MEDHSKLFNEISGFSQRKLKKVETKLTTASGDNVVEKRGAKGLTTAAVKSAAKKLDLQVGLILPGLMIGSQDVAHNKATLEEYGVTHILNLAGDEVENKFEDEYNYLSLPVEDSESTTLADYFEEVFEFIDEGRFRGNCFIHCDSGKPGLSRSTAFCVAYLMKKEKKPYDEAFAEVKEARSFVRPSDSFAKQLKQLNEQLFGSQKKEEIEDPFTKKKRQEIEAEKAALKGGVNLKDRVKLFASSNGTDSTSRAVPSTPAVGKVKWNPMANDTTLAGDTSASDSRNNSSSTNESIGKVKWNPIDAPPNGTRNGVNKQITPASRTSSVNSEGGEGRKLTSIISLFNKTAGTNDQPPLPSGVGAGPANFSINKNTAPAKKWKTVEPPPPPGFVRRTRSRRGFNQDPAIKRIRSRGSLARNRSREMSQEQEVNDKTSATSAPARASSSTVSTTPSSNVSAANADSSERKTGQLAQSETAILTPWRKSSKGSTSSPWKGETNGPPPPPPPPPPSSAPSTKATTIQVSSQVNEPSEPRYRTSYSVSPAKSPEPKCPESVSSNIRADSLPPAPPSNRMVFGKVKPPPMKIIGSSLSTEQRKNEPTTNVLPPPPPPPPPVRYDSKTVTDHNNNNTSNTHNNNNNNNSSKANGHKGNHVHNNATNNKHTNAAKHHHKPVYDYEDSESDSEEESDDDDDYTQIYDHRECPPRGLNRSSTREIISLIKSKTGADLAHKAGHSLGEIDENEEIDNLLAGLENEGIENVDWGELGIELGEVKEIVEKHEDDEEEEEVEEEEEEIEVEVEEEEEEEEEEDDKAIAVTYKINNRPGTRVA